MGSLLIIISIITLILQYQTGQIASRLHMDAIYVYYGLFTMLLIGIVIQIDSSRR